MLRTIKTYALLALIALTATACRPAAQSDGRILLRLANNLPDDHPTSESYMFMRDELARLSDGRIELRLFTNAQLGTTEAVLEQVENGTLEMAHASVASVSQLVPEFNVMMMPYIFRDKAHEYAVVDGEVGQELMGLLERRGLHGLGFLDAGTRNIMTTSGPITTPADLRGRKIRVMDARLMVDTINAMGGAATPMSQGEVYTALQTSVLDGWENNPPTTIVFRMHETGCNYFAWTHHLAIPDMLVMSKQVYERFTPEDRALMDEVAQRMVEFERQRWQEYEQEAITQLAGEGMKFNEVNLDSFRQAVERIYPEYYEKYPGFEQLVERIRAVQAPAQVPAPSQAAATVGAGN